MLQRLQSFVDHTETLKKILSMNVYCLYMYLYKLIYTYSCYGRESLMVDWTKGDTRNESCIYQSFDLTWRGTISTYEMDLDVQHFFFVGGHGQQFHFDHIVKVHILRFSIYIPQMIIYTHFVSAYENIVIKCGNVAVSIV